MILTNWNFGIMNIAGTGSVAFFVALRNIPENGCKRVFFGEDSFYFSFTVNLTESRLFFFFLQVVKIILYTCTTKVFLNSC